MIVSVTGHADAFDLVFTLGTDGKWAVTVPPDLADGRYVCDIYVTNHVGDIAYWTGILYMTDGRFVCLNLLEDNIMAVLLPDRALVGVLGERIIETLVRRHCV